MDYLPYLPILKWRMGEYQALYRLSSSAKKAIYPLFVIPPVEYDFEEGRLKKSAHEHLEPLVDKIRKKWGSGSASLQFHKSLHIEETESGQSLVKLIFDELIEESLNINPVICLEDDEKYISTAITYSREANSGLTFRISFHELANKEAVSKFANILETWILDASLIDLVVDFGQGADYIPFERSTKLVNLLLSKFPKINKYRRVYLVGTTLDFSSVSPESKIEQSRDDWEFYKAFYANYSDKIPKVGFGDFGIEPPSFAPNMDMRVIKPAARLIYSTSNSEWAIVKGSAFRDNPAQMYDICKDFVYNSGHFIDKDLSKGDLRIYECANRSGTNGSLTTWKEAATSHHISLMVLELSNFHE